MIKATLTLVAIATLAGCDASMTTTPADPTAAEDGMVGTVGADGPGDQAGSATPWWGVPG